MLCCDVYCYGVNVLWYDVILWCCCTVLYCDGTVSTHLLPSHLSLDHYRGAVGVSEWCNWLVQELHMRAIIINTIALVFLFFTVVPSVLLICSRSIVTAESFKNKIYHFKNLHWHPYQSSSLTWILPNIPWYCWSHAAEVGTRWKVGRGWLCVMLVFLKGV